MKILNSKELKKYMFIRPRQKSPFIINTTKGDFSITSERDVYSIIYTLRDSGGRYIDHIIGDDELEDIDETFEELIEVIKNKTL